MRAPTVANMLDTWERGLPKGPVERGVMLLELACPGEQEDALAALSVGERDRRLLALRTSLFGPRVVGPLALAWRGRNSGAGRSGRSHDLMAAAAAMPAEAARVLFKRCMVRAELEGSPVDADALPDALVAEAGQKLADADPLTDLRFAMTCIACDHAWLAPFDAAAFLWTELESWADRMLREVHELASAYGWAERDILSLGPVRRARYLRMVEG